MIKIKTTITCDSCGHIYETGDVGPGFGDGKHWAPADWGLIRYKYIGAGAWDEMIVCTECLDRIRSMKAE